MELSTEEILETIHASEVAHLDIRTVTLGISLLDCVSSNPDELIENIYAKITTVAKDLATAEKEVQDELGIPIVNKRISVTPISLVAGGINPKHYPRIAKTLDDAAAAINIDFLGGYTALMHKGATPKERSFVSTIPEALATTDRVCSSLSLASSRAGINMDAVLLAAETVAANADATKNKGGIANAKFVVFANAVEDNPFMAGAFLGVGEPDRVLNVGVSGPGVVLEALKALPDDAPFDLVAETIKRLSFKITRAGELVGRKMARIMGIPFGIIDLSLAPTPAIGDSIANILEAIGLERAGAAGSTAALAMLNDSVKKGGLMASTNVGGLSGAFIPVSEDAGMVRAVADGAMSIEKLEAMTSVCSVGLDMVSIPGDTPVETIAGIIADEMAIGVINNKTTAVRILPIIDAKAGDRVEYGGLLGTAIVQDVSRFSSKVFARRGGRIPAPATAHNN